MKKLIALLLCFVLLLACAVSVSAAGTTTVEIIADKAEAKPGDEITFEVRIDGSETCKSLGIALQYDKTIFEMKEGKCGLENATLSVFNESIGFAYLFQEGIVPEGMVGTFTMWVKEGAVNGTAEVSGQLAVKNGNTTIPSELTPAGVTITGGATEQTEGKSDASTDTAQKIPAQAEPQKQPGGIQPQEQTQNEQPQPQQNDAELSPAESEQEAAPQMQQEAPEQEQPATSTQSVTAPETSAMASLPTELLIAAAVLLLLVVALVVCLVLLAKRKRSRG